MCYFTNLIEVTKTKSGSKLTWRKPSFISVARETLGEQFGACMYTSIKLYICVCIFV